MLVFNHGRELVYPPLLDELAAARVEGLGREPTPELPALRLAWAGRSWW